MFLIILEVAGFCVPYVLCFQIGGLIASDCCNWLNIINYSEVSFNGLIMAQGYNLFPLAVRLWLNVAFCLPKCKLLIRWLCDFRFTAVGLEDFV